MQGFRRLGYAAVVVFLIALFTVVPAAAQTITGSIAGDVTDSTGAVVPNATITVHNVGTGFERTATTSSSGSYRVPELPIGEYKVTATAQGFKTIVRPAEVVTGGVTHADFSLQVGQRTETVEVEGAAPLVELSPNLNNYVDQAKIESVPLNGRDFNSLLAITPGVQRSPGGGFLAVSINGARTTSNNYFIDGLYNNDRYYGDSAVNQTGVVGIPATIFPPEAIQELSVQETPSAEFGVKGGAPILLQAKSGTNALHGWAHWVRHTDFADAANYFSKHNGDNCTAPGECQPTPLRNQQFGGGVNGPIIKDRAFFSVFYEGQRYRSLAVSSRTVPTPDQIQGAKDDIAANGLTVDPVGQALLDFFPISPTGTLVAQTPTTARADGFFAKVDFKLSQKHNLSVKYDFGDSLQSAPSFAGLPAGQSNSPDLFNSVAPSRVQLVGLNWIWNLSNNKILESRLGFTRFAQIIDVNNKIDPKSLGIDTGPLDPADFGVPYVYLLGLGYGGYIGGVQGYPITTRPDQTWDWAEHFSWVKGNHNIKIGGNFQRTYTNSLRNRARTGLVLGYFTYYFNSPSGDAIQDEVEELLLGKADNANRNFGDTHRHIFQNSVGFYAQDDWKIMPRLNLTFGLRWDLAGALSETQNIGSNFFPGVGFKTLGQGLDRLYDLDYSNFGPRAGFAWDIFGNGKTALRGGYALTYDIPNISAFAAPYTFARARAGIFSQPNLGEFASFSVSVDAGLGTAPNDPAAVCGDDYICFSQGPIFGPNPTPEGPFNAFSIVKNLKTPRLHNFNLSMQHEVFRNNVLSATYSGQRGQNLILYRDLNASPVGTPCFSQGACDDFRPLVPDSSSIETDLRHIIQATNLASSQYDSLQLSYNQRGWHGLDTQYNFTWSKCYDDNSVNRGGAGDYPQINNDGNGNVNVRDTRGLCDHDVRLNFNIGGVYAFPTIPHAGKYLGQGWQLSTIYTAISGRPFTVLLGGGSDPSGQGLTGSSIRAAWDGSSVQYDHRNPDRYIKEFYTAYDQADPCGNFGDEDPDNPGHFFGGLPNSPFYTPCAGTVGSSRRNQLIGPGLSQWDVTLFKDTKITEKLTLQFRWEVFNVLNHANFHYFPDNTLGSCGTVLAGGLCDNASNNFTKISKTSDVAVGNPVIAQGGPRNMNFAIKFIF